MGCSRGEAEAMAGWEPMRMRQIKLASVANLRDAGLNCSRPKSLVAAEFRFFRQTPRADRSNWPNEEGNMLCHFRSRLWLRVCRERGAASSRFLGTKFMGGGESPKTFSKALKCDVSNVRLQSMVTPSGDAGDGLNGMGGQRTQGTQRT
jgi:hypothetical protein